MTNPFNYDGTGKLGEAIADLYRCSPRNHNKVAELIQQAKDQLGITSKSKNLPDEVKLAIWQWHYDRLHPATHEDVNIFSQIEQSESVGQSVETISQTKLPLPVDIISQSEQGDSVEIFAQDKPNKTVENKFTIRD